MERGVIVISVDGERIRYKMLPETWEINLADGGRTSEAIGQVQKNKISERFPRAPFVESGIP